MRVRFILVGLVAALVTGGCTSHADEDERIPLTGDLPTEGTVDVTLEDHAIRPDAREAPAGEITMIATNRGQVPHELQIAAIEDPGEMPTLPDGTVDESALGDALIDATGDLTRGDAEQLSIELEDGSYLLFCNLDDHFERGMFTPFSVEPSETETDTTTTTAAAT